MTTDDEKIWEAVVVVDASGQKQVVRLTKGKLAEIDPDQITVLRYVGKPPEPWWWRRNKKPQTSKLDAFKKRF